MRTNGTRVTVEEVAKAMVSVSEVSMQERWIRGVKSQKKWSISLGPQKVCLHKRTIVMAVSRKQQNQDPVANLKQRELVIRMGY